MILSYAFELRCVLLACVCLSKNRQICVSGGSMRSGMTVKWDITCQCVHLHVLHKIIFFLSFLILIWDDLFILRFCFVFLTGLIAPFCPIFVSVKGPGRKLSLPTDLKTDLGTVGRKRADLFLYSCLRCINFLCFHPVENDMMKPFVFAFTVHI